MSGIEIHIGSPIEHGSDRAVLKRVAELLSAKGGDALILANVNLGGRQIDLVVALDHLTLVIEAKGFAVPVRGAQNGAWQVCVASGGWKNIPNPYLQTVGAKYALRDAMQSFSGTDVAYPSAALVFTPSIPVGSSPYQGDFKAAVIGLDSISDLLDETRTDHWSLDQWRAFVVHHSIKRVDRIESAFDPQIADAEDLIRAYVTAYQRTYGPLTEELIPYPCRDEQEACSSTAVIKRGAMGTSLLLYGPSGCGKSLAIYRIGVDSIDCGRVPILVQGKNFVGSLRDTVNAEATLLDVPSATALLSACRRLDYPILLLVDGYNECAEAERGRLTRSIAAASRRYGGSIVVTAQSFLDRGDLLQLHEIAVSEPDADTKSAIATRASGGVPLHDSIEPLLNSISSGLEARLLGEIGRDIAGEPSRYAIFDAYVRKRLGAGAADGIRALARIAGFLSDRVSFGLTVRELDRVSERENISAGLLQRLHETNLLTTRGDRASFGHELFLNAFTAEAVIRRGNGEASEVLAALRSPRHAERQALIVGAIDDEALLTGVLNEISDATLIEACFSGQCGAHARLWAERRGEEVFRRMRAEIEQIEFEISDEAWLKIRPVVSSLFQWTPQEKSFLRAFAIRVSGGHLFDAILDVIAAMDRRLVHEHTRLRDEARVRKIGLRSGLFANTYVSSSGAAISMVCVPVHSGMTFREKGTIIAKLVYERLLRGDASQGQIYSLLALSRLAVADKPSIAPLLPDILRRYWVGAAYHLRLDLLQAAQFCGRANEPERLALIQALEELPLPEHIFLSTSLVEALQSLGALDESETEHINVVRTQIREIFADQDNPDMRALAFGLWVARFDHPYAGAYCEAISELSEDEKKLLLRLVGEGADQEATFANILILELAESHDPAVCPIITRWMALPPTRCVMPQDGIGNFATSHIALARLGGAIPEPASGFDSDAAEALAACGRILYWLNRFDLPMERRRSECAQSLATLSRHELGVSANVVGELYRAHSLSSEAFSRLQGSETVYTSIGDAFPAEIAEICRQCVRFPMRQRGYFDYFDRKGALAFAVSGIGQWGDVTDLMLLRELSHDPQLGTAAIRAIKSLDQIQTAGM